MGLTRRQDDGFVPAYLEALAGDRNLRLAIENVEQGVEWGGVLAKFLPGVEGKQGYVPGLRLADLATDDGAVLAGDQFDET